MQIRTSGYPIKFIQRDRVRDNTSHLESYIYKFTSTQTKLHYVVRAEYHEFDFFAVKFYAKKDRRSDFKYQKIINKGDVANILVTCSEVLPELLHEFPDCSFGFIGARSVDLYSNKVEGYINNQRYRLYKYHIPQLIGDRTFLHKAYRKSSSYILLNRNKGDLERHEKAIVNMVVSTYPELLNAT